MQRLFRLTRDLRPGCSDISPDLIVHGLLDPIVGAIGDHVQVFRIVKQLDHHLLASGKIFLLRAPTDATRIFPDRQWNLRVRACLAFDEARDLVSRRERRCACRLQLRRFGKKRS